MDYFPAFIKLNGEPVLIVGGGSKALEKVERLEPFYAQITIVSPILCPELAQRGGFVWLRQVYDETLLDTHPRLVIAADDDLELNVRVSEDAQRRHIPINAVDQPEACTFIFPAMLATDKLCVAISSSGASPSMAVELKRRVGELIPEQMDGILDQMPAIRQGAKGAGVTGTALRAILRTAVQLALDAGRPLTDAEISALLG